MMSTNDKIDIIEYGDYQTPVLFANSVCKKLKEQYKMKPDVVFEPTFGVGNFINASLDTFENLKACFGVEINPYYYELTKDSVTNKINTKIELFNFDIFSFDFSLIKEQINHKDNLLIVGNPPWVTNSQLTSNKNENIPLKTNFKRNSGLNAITGKGNFDIAEYIVLQLLSEFANYNCTIALLCKTIVAKNVIRDMAKYNFNIEKSEIHTFNANVVFGVSCEACLFVAKLGNASSGICEVYDYDTHKKTREFGWVNGSFCSDIDREGIIDIEGKSQFEWRQGVKHDCAKVMELKKKNNVLQNGFGDELPFVVGNYIYPLLKSSDIKKHEIKETNRFVIATQKRVNEDTSFIKNKCPFVWKYLSSYEELLNNRKSVIYKKAPKFAMFGVGDYSYAKYKVGVSGFYKEPIFALIYNEYPVMLDDTCYFLSFDDKKNAIITTALLNSDVAQNFLKSIAFLESKRPYTKEILKRIDFVKLSENVDYAFVHNFAATMSGDYFITKEDYENYTMNICEKQLEFAI